jgi:hypothetical protein
VGTTFRITVSGTCTSSSANLSHFKVYIGSGAAGTTANQALAVDIAPTSPNSGSNIPFSVEAIVTIRATGAGGTASILGSGVLSNNGATGVTAAASGNVVAQTTTAATGTNFATTGTNNIYLDYVSAATTTTCTFYNAAIEIVKP